MEPRGRQWKDSEKKRKNEHLNMLTFTGIIRACIGSGALLSGRKAGKGIDDTEPWKESFPKTENYIVKYKYRNPKMQ